MLASSAVFLLFTFKYKAWLISEESRSSCHVILVFDLIATVRRLLTHSIKKYHILLKFFSSCIGSNDVLNILLDSFHRLVMEFFGNLYAFGGRAGY